MPRTESADVGGLQERSIVSNPTATDGVANRTARSADIVPLATGLPHTSGKFSTEHRTSFTDNDADSRPPNATARNSGSGAEGSKDFGRLLVVS